MTGTVTVTTGDGEMEMYEASPSADAKGAVVVVQEAFGVNGHIEDVCRRFAAEGYHAVAPHLFHRTGDPVLGYSQMDEIRPHMGALTMEGILADVDASLSHVRAAGFEGSGTGIVGFCMGGSVTFLVAARRAIGAAVTFYGGGVAEGRFGMPPLVEMAPDLQTPWLGLFGDLDQGIPVDQVEALRKAAAEAKVPTEIVRYKQAEHGFHCNERSSYHEASARDGWARTLEWFGRYLAAGR
jgi:carboxymethylenebutenolidase